MGSMHRHLKVACAFVVVYGISAFAFWAHG
jgi:hypothetical protein